MKKNLLIILASFLFVFYAHSQITITSSNIIDVGDVVCRAYDTIPNGSIVPGGSGASQVWDFSTLAVHNRDTMTFVDPSITPYDTSFTGDNAAAFMSNENFWGYFYKSASLLQTVGVVGDMFGNGTPLEIEFNPRETIMSFPFTYMDVLTDTSSFEIIMDTIKMVQTTYKTIGADGWGSVITPVGTFNALRLATTKIEQQSLFLLVAGFWVPAFSQTDTSYSYEWWTDNTAFKFPVVTFNWNPDSMQVDGDVEYLEATFVSSGILDKNIDVKLYPNPSSGIFHIKCDNIRSIEIINISGKLVYSKSFEGIISNININLRDYSKGIYLINIYTDQGLINKKIIIE